MVGKHHRIPATSIQKLRKFLDEDHMTVESKLATKCRNVGSRSRSRSLTRTSWPLGLSATTSCAPLG